VRRRDEEAAAGSGRHGTVPTVRPFLGCVADEAGAGGSQTDMFTLESFVNMTRHKRLKLDQRKIDRANKLLGARTEQETIDRALDLVLGEERILKAHRRVRAVGGFDDAR
jgi:hypothetical protein